MKNYILQIEYFGGNYCGWQKQLHSKSVQEEVEKSLSKIANHNIETICAGRTDTGVHATSQIINFNSSADRSLYAWQYGLNGLLPSDIKIISIEEVSLDFNARFSARRRTYNYLIYNSKVSSPILESHSLWENRPLDIAKMNEACKHLIGKHDYDSFRSSRCQSHSAVRTMYKAEFTKFGKIIVFEVVGNAFLHHMIRNFVGSLLKVGIGLEPAEWIGEVLKMKDRTKAFVTAKPDGLYFVGVEYEEYSFERKIIDTFI